MPGWGWPGVGWSSGGKARRELQSAAAPAESPQGAPGQAQGSWCGEGGSSSTQVYLYALQVRLSVCMRKSRLCVYACVRTDDEGVDVQSDAYEVLKLCKCGRK